MSIALKPKKISSQQEDEDKIQYIQVKKTSQIKAILKAQKDTVKKEEKPLISQKQNEPKETPQPIQQKKEKKFAFIKDDRQRQYPKQKQQAKQQFKPKSQEANQPVKSNLKDKKQPSKRFDEKQKTQKQQSAKQRKIYKDDVQESDKQYTSKRTKYVQKKQEKNYSKYQDNDYTPQKQAPSKKGKYVEKVQQKPKFQQYESKKGKYIQKGQQKTIKYKEKRLKNRIQIQTRNGEQIQIQLTENQDQLQNQVFIGKKSSNEYFTLCKTLLKKYDFIVVKAFGHLVSKAFLIAGLLAQDYSQLKQINIPSAVKVNQYSRGEKKAKTRGAITIQLSLNSLDKRHMGYQDSYNKYNSNKNDKKREKPQQNQKFKEKVENERQLR